MNRILIALAMSTALVTGAAAADLGGGKKHKPATAEQSLLDPAPVVDRPASWTGPWFDIMGGYSIATLTPSSEDFGLSAQGGFGQVDAGFDYQFGRGVVGVELCASYSFIDHAGEGYCGAIRAGLLVTPDTLAYGLGGYRWQSIDTGSDSIFASGPFAGLGMESRITQNMSLKVEAQHHWITDVDGESVPDEIDASDNRVMGGLVFRFGGAIGGF